MSDRPIIVGDIGATQLRLAVAHGHALGEITKHPTPVPGRHFWDELTEMIATFAREQRGVGLKLAIAGAVRAGHVASPLMRGSYALGPILSERLSVPVTVANDLQAVAQGELEEGAAKGLAEALVVTVSTGLNAVVIRGGVVLPDPPELHAEYGHRELPEGLLATPRRDPVCGLVCFDENASGLSVYVRARAVGLEFAENRDFDRLAARGEVTALELYEQEGQLLGEWLAMILRERPVPVVILQGTFARRGFAYFEWPLRERLSQKIGKVPEFRLGALGDDAGLVGASYLR